MAVMVSDWRWQPELMSVVIPTYNRVAVLLRVLAGFEMQTLSRAAFEVIVVDDGSTDDTATAVADYQARCPYRLRLVQQANAGPATARNTGLRAAQGEVVVFVDDDCIPQPALLAEHRASHCVEGLAVIGRIVWHPELSVTPLMAYAERELFFAYQRITLLDDAPFMCFYTGNASIHRQRALDINGFNQQFPRAMYEDLEFAYRLRLSGVRFAYSPAATVWHYRSTSYAPTIERQRVAGREVMRFWTLFPELGALIPFDQLLAPDWRRHFYRVVLGYGLMLGARTALAQPDQLDPDEALPADFADTAPLLTDSASEQEANARELASRTLCVALAEAAALEVQIADLGRWAAAQTTEAAALEQQLAALSGRRLAVRLADRVERRLTGLGQGAGAGSVSAGSARRLTDTTDGPITPLWLSVPPVSWPPHSISVVIVASPEPPALEPVLDGLAAQTLPSDRFNVIVVDDSSGGTLADELATRRADRPFRLTILRSAGRGPAAARNLGLRQATGDIVLWLGATMVPSPDCLASHLAGHTAESMVVLGPIQCPPERAVSRFDLAGEPERLFAESGLSGPFAEPVALFTAEHASVQRHQALAIGGFDESLPPDTLEQFDFAYRLQQAGAVFHYRPTALVWRTPGREVGPAFAQAQRRGAALAQLLEHHPSLAAASAPLSAADLRERYYDALATYYLVLGVSDALAEPSRFDLPAWLAPAFFAEVERWRERPTPARLEKQASFVHDQSALAGIEAWLADLRAELQRRRVAYRQQAAWLADLRQQVAAAEPSALVRRVERLTAGLSRPPRGTPASTPDHGDG